MPPNSSPASPPRRASGATSAANAHSESTGAPSLRARTTTPTASSILGGSSASSPLHASGPVCASAITAPVSSSMTQNWYSASSSSSAPHHSFITSPCRLYSGQTSSAAGARSRSSGRSACVTSRTAIPRSCRVCARAPISRPVRSPLIGDGQERPAESTATPPSATAPSDADLPGPLPAGPYEAETPRRPRSTVRSCSPLESGELQLAIGQVQHRPEVARAGRLALAAEARVVPADVRDLLQVVHVEQGVLGCTCRSGAVDRAVLQDGEAVVVVAGDAVGAHVVQPPRQLGAMRGAQALELAYKRG